jgi:hypothetical protein
MNRLSLLGYIVLAFILISLLSASLVQASNNSFALEWWLLGGSGGGRITSGDNVLQGTLGQTSTGLVSNGNASLCSGFWCGVTGKSEFDLFIPLILKDH